MQDFTGVPAVVDLAAMRDAMAALGGDPSKINPLVPAELVIDHSVQVDDFGTRDAFQRNAELEFERNRERYAFLRWGQEAFDDFKVVPPDTGIVHQVNLEYLARVVFVRRRRRQAYPDTLVGTDSHTTMINGLGVLGWGVGGIEAEAAMLGQPMSMLIPQVVGFQLHGELPEGATATDLVLTVTEMLRKHGVVGKFVEFFGPGVGTLPLADRATIANMAPSTARPAPSSRSTPRRCATCVHRPRREQVALVEAYARSRACGTTPTRGARPTPRRSSSTSATVVPSLAGPKPPAGPRRAHARPRRVPRWRSTDAAPTLTPSDEAVAETFPASDPIAESRQRRRPAPTPSAEPAGADGRRAGRRPRTIEAPVTLADGTETSSSTTATS